MVGMERAVLPLLAAREFHIASNTAILSFLVSFGIVKAFANLAAGRLCDRIGRRSVLIAGWLAGLPVPVLIIWAPAWGWVVFANVLLGINQGLCWSTAIIMKTDLAGPSDRGLVLGWNESAGYLSIAAAAWGSGWLGSHYGLRPYPFAIGVICSILGLLVSVFFIRDTDFEGGRQSTSWRDVIAITSWRSPTLSAFCQAGLTVNLNDGMAWGLLPLLFAANGLSVTQIGLLAALYPGIRGLLQLGSGWLSDRIGRLLLIGGGLSIQCMAGVLLAASSSIAGWTAGVALLGIGVAAVYPTLLAAVTDDADPKWRASALGVYRFWRDCGYAIGALGAGLIADWLGMRQAIAAASLLTLAAGIRVVTTVRGR